MAVALLMILLLVADRSYLLRQQHWLNHTFPEHAVVYKSDDPGEIAPSVSSAAIRPLARTNERVCFVHARSGPAGRERLVVLSLSERAFSRIGPIEVRLTADVYAPAGWRPRSKIGLMRSSTFSIQVSDTENLSLFSGRTDPSDASRFFMKYKLASSSVEEGSIECLLKDDDSVDFEMVLQRQAP
jgi:hypothetical protein